MRGALTLLLTCLGMAVAASGIGGRTMLLSTMFALVAAGEAESASLAGVMLGRPLDKEGWECGQESCGRPRAVAGHRGWVAVSTCGPIVDAVFFRVIYAPSEIRALAAVGDVPLPQRTVFRDDPVGAAEATFGDILRALGAAGWRCQTPPDKLHATCSKGHRSRYLGVYAASIGALTEHFVELSERAHAGPCTSGL